MPPRSRPDPQGTGATFNLNGYEVFSTASVGIALSATGYDQPDLLRDADTAMYHAKALGKARYEVFEHNARQHKGTLVGDGPAGC